ncbi:MAG: hypothetical protein ACREFJ_19475 [Acetobacteraceae bacterium]
MIAILASHEGKRQYFFPPHENDQAPEWLAFVSHDMLDLPFAPTRRSPLDGYSGYVRMTNQGVGAAANRTNNPTRVAHVTGSTSPPKTHREGNDQSH